MAFLVQEGSVHGFDPRRCHQSGNSKLPYSRQWKDNSGLSSQTLLAIDSMKNEMFRVIKL